jgi:glycosyltransferase involved in cell wall biosynthesis
LRIQAKSVDVIDCHLGYPDGFAGALLAWRWRKPFTVTLRGFDVNELMDDPIRSRQVVWALKRSNRYFGVAQALINGAAEMGAPRHKGFHSPNGVDAEKFPAIPRDRAREKLGWDPEPLCLLTVCHLVPRKGVDILLRALRQLRTATARDVRLVVVGKGGEEGDVEEGLRALARDAGLDPYVRWAGAVDHADLFRYYAACDLFCLASEKEGWPNVLLEAMSCGLPSVAFSTWGVPEILSDPSLGVLVRQRTPSAFRTAIQCGLDRKWDRAAIARRAKRYDWANVARQLRQHFEEVCTPGKRRSRALSASNPG